MTLSGPNILLCGALLSGAALSAQEGSGRITPIFGQIEDDGRKPLVGASVLLQPDEPHHIDWLRGWTPTQRRLSGTSNDQGRFRFPAQRHGGALLVRHPSGLGAVRHHIAPGTPQRIAARPMAELRLQLPTKPSPAPLEWHVQSATRGGERQSLGRFIGTTLRLPAGHYHVLLRQADRMREFDVHARSGRVQSIAPPTTMRDLALPEDFRGRLSPRHWPEVRIAVRDGKARVPVDGMEATAWQETGPRSFAVQHLFLQAGLRQLQLAPRNPRSTWTVQDEHGKALPGARVFALSRSDDGDFIVRSCAVTNSAGQATACADEDDLVAAWFVDHQLAIADAAMPRRSLTLRSVHGVQLQLSNAKGRPIGNAQIEIRVPDRPTETRTTTSSVRGEVHLRGLAAGTITLRVIGTRTLAMPHRLTIKPDQRNTQTIRLPDGKSFAGQVLMPGGKPAVGAEVLLRDPTGTTGVRTTRAWTDAGGRFVVHGMPAEVFLAMSASLQRDAGSWISKTTSARAGSGHRILLQPEDPPPPGKH